MAEIQKLTHLQHEALFALGKFKFLNAPQLARKLGCVKNSVTRAMRGMPDNLIGWHDMGLSQGFGRLPRIYFLKKKGEIMLEELGADEIKIPKGKVLITPITYAHRIGIVDCHMAIDTFLEQEELDLNFFETDFEFTGSN